ncbi:hypothetical protein BKI52_35580 [marine bacterium AO1-C]|nr:hypothetical protein BKI52_35580 [marine bacterium AO1-C]
MKNYVFQNDSSPVSFNYDYANIIDYQCQLEASKYYVAVNNTIPNVIAFYENLDIDKLLDKIKNSFDIEANQIWKYESYSRKKDKIAVSNFILHIKRDLLLCYDEDDNYLKILYSDQIAQPTLDELTRHIKDSFGETKAEGKIFLLYENNNYLYLKDFEVKKSELDITSNYNDDFSRIHELVVKRLNTSDDKGLVLLHGEPGTGKTSYIRYLTSLIDKKMIYIPPEYAHKIASPDFLTLLIANPNSILIIEDAENIVEERDGYRNASVANLLNVADGLLSDCLNIQILCTFNAHISKIDKALLRKGRLIAMYEFEKLAAEKAQLLSDKLGYKTNITEATTLANIYNQEELKFSEKESIKIGF